MNFGKFNMLLCVWFYLISAEKTSKFIPTEKQTQTMNNAPGFGPEARGLFTSWTEGGLNNYKYLLENW